MLQSQTLNPKSRVLKKNLTHKDFKSSLHQTIILGGNGVQGQGKGNG